MTTPEPGRLFGNLLRLLRHNAGLTQAQLAEAAGLGLGTIKDLETGKRKAPRWDTIKQLAEALKLDETQHQRLKDAAHPDYALPSPAPSAPIPTSPELHLADGETSSALSDGAPLEQRLLEGGYAGTLPDCALVDRQSERAWLQEHIAAVTAGRGRIALLRGEPGIGKTRLIQEATAIANEAHFLIVAGRCYEPQTSIPYYPFFEALSTANSYAPPAIGEAVPRRWPLVRRLQPEVVADSAAVGDNSPEQQQILFWQVTGFLQALAEQRPIALVLDDLHWADSASLALFAHLARHISAHRILMLGTFRDAEANQYPPLVAVLQDLLRDKLFAPLMVKRLSPQGTRELVVASLHDQHIPDTFLQLVHTRAEGNPFYTHEVIRALTELGSATRIDQRWDYEAMERLDITASLAQTLGKRLSALSAVARQVLGEASVLGHVFTLETLLLISHSTPQEVEDALSEAESLAFVRETAQGYTFEHMLTQEVLYDNLTKRIKRQLHLAVGEALERIGAPAGESQINVLAYHFALSTAYDKALHYTVLAANLARQANARREEAKLIEQAIEAATHLHESAVIPTLYARCGKAFAAATAWPDARRAFAAALRTCTPEQVELRAETSIDIAQVVYMEGDIPAIRVNANEALSLAEQLRRDDLAASAITALGLADSNEGRLGESQKQFRMAFARVGSESHPALLYGLDQYGLNAYYFGQFADAITYTQRALAIARDSHETAIIIRTLGNLGLTFTSMGNYQEALQMFAEARLLGREYRTNVWLGRSIAMCANIYLTLCDFEKAEALTEEARDLGHATSFPAIIASTGIDLLVNYLQTGQLGKIAQMLPLVQQNVAQSHGTHGWLTKLRFTHVRAEYALAQRQWEEALGCAEETIDRAQMHGRVKYEALGRQARAHALIALNRTKDAIVDLHTAVALTRSTGDPAQFVRAAAALLPIAGDDALLAEAREAVQRVTAAAPPELRETFANSVPPILRR